jgi:hypothetical protein
MKLPFTVEQFLQVFKSYNQSIFPLQNIFYVLAILIIFLAVKKINGADRLINLILSFFWLWMGIVYHLIFFTAINKAAYLFGSLFIVQGVLFFYFGVIKQKLNYTFLQNKWGVLGLVLMLFALFIYPLLSYLFGHGFPLSPTFGVPCPTTIFSFGVFLWSTGSFPKVLLIIPFLWSLLGFSAATTLGIKEDAALLVAGFLTTAILMFRKQELQTAL